MRVLIADDDRLVCDLLGEYVRACQHEVVATITGGGLAAIRSFTVVRPDVVLLDVVMPRCNGLTACHALLSRDPAVKVVLMSGFFEQEHPFIAGCHAAGFLPKPVLLKDVRNLLNSFCAPVEAPRPPEYPRRRWRGSPAFGGQKRTLASACLRGARRPGMPAE